MARTNEQRARRAYLAENRPDFCTRCKRKHTRETIEAGYRNCLACRAKERKRRELAAQNKAHELYVQKIALLRAQRKIEQHEAEQRKRLEEAKAHVERIFGPEPDRNIVSEFEV